MIRNEFEYNVYSNAVDVLAIYAVSYEEKGNAFSFSHLVSGIQNKMNEISEARKVKQTIWILKVELADGGKEEYHNLKSFEDAMQMIENSDYYSGFNKIVNVRIEKQEV